MYVCPQGQQFEKRYGSRVSVWEGSSYQTSSGLLREHLKENKRGKIVSKRRSAMMLDRYKKFGGLKKIEEVKEEVKEMKTPERPERPGSDRKAPVITRRRRRV